MPYVPDSSTSSTCLGLPRSVWVLGIVSFLADVSGEMVYPLLPLFVVNTLGASKGQLGAMEGGAALVVALMSAYAGIMSDRKGVGGGRVVWIRWGYGLPVIGKSIIALAAGWPAAFSGRILDRLGKGLRGSPRDALIADAVTPDSRGRAFGLHRAFDTTGAMVGVLLSALLLWWLTASLHQTAGKPADVTETPAWIYRLILGIGAVLGLGSLILTFFVKEPDPGPARTLTAIRESAAASVENSGISPAGAECFNLPCSYWCDLGVLVLFSFANSSDTFLLLRAQDLGYSPWSVVLAYALCNVTYSLLSFPIGVLSDRIGRWRIITSGWAIYAGVYAGFAILPASQAWAVWPLMALYGVTMALTDGVGKSLIADHAPQVSRGAAIGLFYGLTGLTTLAASLLAGLLWDRWGPTAALLPGAGFAVLALTVAHCRNRPRKAADRYRLRNRPDPHFIDNGRPP